jgi:bifunctional non-homologous end joining protein LigD
LLRAALRRCSRDAAAARDRKGPPVALLARGELDDLRHPGGAIIALSPKDREALRLAADYLQASKPVVKHTGKQQALWLKPGLIARVWFLRGEENRRHATVTDVRAA